MRRETIVFLLQPGRSSQKRLKVKMSHEFGIILAYCEMDEYFSLLLGNCFDIFLFKEMVIMNLYHKIWNILMHMTIFVYSNYLFWKITPLQLLQL